MEKAKKDQKTDQQKQYEKFEKELQKLQEKYKVELYASNVILPNGELVQVIKYKNV